MFEPRWHLVWSVLLGALVLTAWAPAVAGGTDGTDVPIIRPLPGYPRIFVQAELPNGERGLFLVDTGADISVLSRGTAERLGLPIQERYTRLEGLSGTAWMDRAVLPSIGLGEGGETRVEDIEVAVGVPGFTDQVHFLPLDGLLGNNVWANFVLEVDYPRNLIVLHEPDTVRRTRRPPKGLWRVDRPGRVAPMHFDGQHVFSPITVTTGSDAARTETVITQVDTGAGGLKLCAATGLPFQDDFTEGLESIRGIGASETLPPHRFLEMTRRIPIREVVLGGRSFEVNTSAQWLLYDRLETDRCPAGMRALLGHEFLSRHRVFFDYGNGRLALTRSRGKPRPVNGHEVFLEQDIAEYGEDRPERALYRAKLQIGAANDEAAVALLEALPDGLPADETAEAQVLLTRIYRHRGELDKAWAILRALKPGELVDQEEIVASVNGLLFEDEADEALELADAAVAARPEAGNALVARADARLFMGDADGAQADLLAAARLEEYPDAHLLRRARIALVRDDRYGSMTHVRKLLRLYPFAGEFLWFYAMLVEDERDAQTFRSDMEAAMARLHPGMKPIDFQVAAHHAIGDDDVARELMERGIDEMCVMLPEDSTDYDNCLAWFYALAGVRTDEALRRVDRALAETGDRSDYLDTKAMVHLSRGELDAATESAWAAARLSPADVYMLWQAERIRDLRDQQRRTYLQ